jgi:hypothetical protein
LIDRCVALCWSCAIASKRPNAKSGFKRFAMGDHCLRATRAAGGRIVLLATLAPRLRDIITVAHAAPPSPRGFQRGDRAMARMYTTWPRRSSGRSLTAG